MDNDRKEKLYCDEDGEYRIYCHVCDKLAIDRYYNNHLKTQTHINNSSKGQQLNNTKKFNIIRIINFKWATIVNYVINQ